jgi:hypothetical protein
LKTGNRKRETRKRSNLFSGIDFYLLQSLQDFIGQANVNNGKVQRNNCHDDQAANNPFHKNLRVEIEFIPSYKQKRRQIKLKSSDYFGAVNPRRKSRRRGGL